ETATPPVEHPRLSRYLCLEDPPNLPESVIEVWFKPYGSLLEMRRVETEKSMAYVVQLGRSVHRNAGQLSSEDEAMRAHEALNGKAIMGKSLSVRYWHESGATAEALMVLDSAEIDRNDRCPGPGMGIDDQQLVDACKVVLEATACVVALAQRKQNLEAQTAAPAPKGGDVESWEDLEEDTQDMSFSDVPSDALCISGVPPGIQEMVMQFWFRPYGQVLELRPISSSELGCRVPAYLVKLSSIQEATAARAALDGKPVMKGSPLVVRYWHG
ncbi:unnamed protein product, partial [Cladocopium goreaui]